MTDVSQTQRTGGGIAKAGLAALYFDICQHMTPPLAGYLNQRFPLLGIDLSFEIVVFAQSTIGGAIIKWTPTHFIDGIISAIRWIKASCKRIRSAADQP